MKLIIKLITITLLSAITTAEVKAQSDFTTFHIKDIGVIDIPSSVELQKGSYKEGIQKWINKELNNMYNVYMNKIYMNKNRIVFQQKGLNNFSSKAFKKYFRIILETKIGNRGDFEKLTFNPGKITRSDIQELNKVFKRQLITSFSLASIKLKLIKFYGVNVEEVNHQTCIKICYLRKLNDNPFVKVSAYIFENNDRMHSLIISYRLNEEDFWKSKVEKILNSFKITNIR